MDNREINKLKRKRTALNKKMAVLGHIMRGSVVQLGATCGNPNCRCARGEKHQKYYFSLSVKGKTKVIYLGKLREPMAREYSQNYKALLEIVEEMTTINMRLLKAKASKNK